MNVAGAVVVTFIVTVVIVKLVGWIRGCANGHVWGDWEWTGRIKAVPYHHGDPVVIQKQMERECECEKCRSTRDDWRYVGEADKDDVLEVVQSIVEDDDG